MIRRKTFAYVKLGMQKLLAYKFEVATFFFISILSLIVYYYLWHSIYSFTGQSTINGFDFTQLMAYYILIFFEGGFIWTNLDQRISDLIRDGTLIIDLARPTTLMNAYVSDEFGADLLVILIQGTPLLVAGVIFFHLSPASLLSLILSAISFAMAVALSITFVFLTSISSFWLTRYHAVRYARSTITWFFGGGIVPIAFFPSVWQKVFALLPFQHFIYTPVSIFLGYVQGWNALGMIGMQVFWVIIFYLLIKLAWPKAMTKFSAAGG